MHATTRAAALLALTATVLAAAPAQAAGHAADPCCPPGAVVFTMAGDSIVSAVPADAAHYTELAYASWNAGRLGRARREFLTAARLLREAGILPVAALREAAAVDFSRADAMGAAFTMDQLGQDAIAMGDPNVQMQALLDAATLYAQARRPELAQARLATIRPLLASPFLTEPVRAEVASRTGMGGSL